MHVLIIKTQGQFFDTGYPVPIFQKLIDEGSIPQGRCLVPGCGRAYDVAALASPDRYILGIDISEVAVQAASEWIIENDIQPRDKIEVKCLNFFDLDTKDENKFDFVYDYTFLCALDPSIREDWARQMSALIRPGGELLTLIFPIQSEEGGTYVLQ